MDTFCTTFSLFEQRFVPIKCQTSGKKNKTKTKLTYMNYGEVSMFEICLVILSGVSNFLTVWRFDCCRPLYFAPSVFIYGFPFFHSALLCMSSQSCLSHDSTVTADQRPVPCLQTVCSLRRPEIRPSFF